MVKEKKSPHYHKDIKYFVFIFLVNLFINCNTTSSGYVNDMNNVKDNSAMQTPVLELDAVNGILEIEITPDHLEGEAVESRSFFFRNGEVPSAAIYNAIDGKNVDGIFITRWIEENESSFLSFSNRKVTKVRGRGVKIKNVGTIKFVNDLEKQLLLIEYQIDFKKKQMALLKKYMMNTQGELQFIEKIIKK